VIWGLGTVGSSKTEMQNHIKNKNKQTNKQKKDLERRVCPTI
jgi:hypothetical protein